MKTIVGITGTTCVGKSQVAVQLAKMLKTEIVSADSMQIYKGMDIGTAKITQSQAQGVKHHMIDIVDPNKHFSSFLYQESAAKIIDDMKTLPLVVGGTGLYFDSLLYPPEFGEADSSKRQQLKQELSEKGLDALCERLKELDSDTYEKIDLKNPVRVMRALEIAESGEKKSLGKGRCNPKYDCKLFVLQRERTRLYHAIETRVDEMVEHGLIDEVQRLVDTYGICDTPAFSAIGYKEIVAHLQGNITLQQAVEQIKLNTKHYAKRQITYFKRMNVCQFVDIEGRTIEEIAEKIYTFCVNLC